MDQDGDPDILVGTRLEGEIKWFSNNGSGLYEGPHVITTDAVDVSHVFTKDMDQDGDLDIIVMMTFDTHRLAYIENFGQGAYSQLQDIGTPGQFRWEIQVVDMDGDNFPDILLTGDNPMRSYWMKNMGQSQFIAQPTIYSVSSSSFLQTLVDVNADGVADLYIQQSDTAGNFWMEGTGNGVFSGVNQLPQSWPEHRIFTFADIDQDGLEDIVTTSASFPRDLELYLNDGANGFLPVQLLDTNIWGNLLIDVVDIDTDGDLDLVGMGQDIPVFWVENINGDLSVSGRIEITNVPLSLGVLSFDDADGDGNLDILLTAQNVMGVLRNMGNGVFQDIQPIGRGAGSPVVKADSDLDQDGHMDLLVISMYDSRLLWFPGEPGKLFDSYNYIDTEVRTISDAVVNDFDQDGDPDIIATSNNTGEVVWYQNLGNGQFGPSVLIHDLSVFINDIEQFDMDNDGDMDLFLTGYYPSASLLKMEQVSAGQFAVPIQIDTMYGHQMDHADLDGDGDIDLLTSRSYHHGVNWYANDGAGNFSPANLVTSQAYYPKFVLAADIDNDGDQDVVSTNAQGDLTWYENNGIGQFNDSHTLDVSASVLRQAVAHDLDGDSVVDLIAWYDDDSLSWFRNDGTGTEFTEYAIGTVERNQSICFPSDVDGDGDVDILSTALYWSELMFYENFINSPYGIEGNVYADWNADGIRDPQEIGLSFVPVSTIPQLTTALSNGNGDYRFYLPQGVYTVAPFWSSPLWQFSSDSASFTIDLNNGPPLVSDVDFGYSPIGAVTDIELNIIADHAPCGGQSTQFLSILNSGNTLPSGSICYELDSLFEFVSSVPPPTSVSGNIYCWEYDSLYYFSQQLISLVVNNPHVDSLSSDLNNYLTVTVVDTMGNVINTYSEHLLDYVECAYDPNDKQVEPIGYGVFGAVDIATDHVDYTIRFQNTGTAPAIDVMLRDQLSTHLDWNSIQILGHSHTPAHIQIEQDGELVVEFDNINLVDSATSFTGSQGFFKFRIALDDGLLNETAINNSAEIYFDFNPPVTTNTTTTTVVDCNLWSPDITDLSNGVLEAPQGIHYQWFLDGAPLLNDTNQILFVGQGGDYTVQVTSVYGCVATSSEFMVVGIEEITGPQLAIIPNPFTDHSRLICSEVLTSDHLIELVDMQGRIVVSTVGNGSNEVMIERNGLINGLYMIRIREGNTILGTTRIVIL